MSGHRGSQRRHNSVPASNKTSDLSESGNLKSRHSCLPVTSRQGDAASYAPGERQQGDSSYYLLGDREDKGRKQSPSMYCTPGVRRPGECKEGEHKQGNSGGYNQGSSTYYLPGDLKRGERKRGERKQLAVAIPLTRPVPLQRNPELYRTWCEKNNSMVALALEHEKMRRSENGGHASENGGQGRDNYERRPESGGQESENGGHRWDDYERLPENGGQESENVDRGRENYERRPENGGKAPENGGQGRENYERRPENGGLESENGGHGRENYERRPENGSNAPENGGQGREIYERRPESRTRPRPPGYPPVNINEIGFPVQAHVAYRSTDPSDANCCRTSHGEIRIPLDGSGRYLDLFSPPVVQASSVLPRSVKPSSVQPQSVKPFSVQPRSVKPVSVQPQSVMPSCIQPSSIQTLGVHPSIVQPQSVKLSSVQPQSVKPFSVQPRSVKSSSVQPQSVLPSCIQPSSIQTLGVHPSIVQPQSVKLSSVQPQIVKPPRVQTQIVMLSNIQPTSIQPSSVNVPNIQPQTMQPPNLQTSSIQSPGVEPPSRQRCSNERPNKRQMSTAPQRFERHCYEHQQCDEWQSYDEQGGHTQRNELLGEEQADSSWRSDELQHSNEQLSSELRNDVLQSNELQCDELQSNEWQSNQWQSNEPQINVWQSNKLQTNEWLSNEQKIFEWQNNEQQTNDRQSKEWQNNYQQSDNLQSNVQQTNEWQSNELQGNELQINEQPTYALPSNEWQSNKQQTAEQEHVEWQIAEQESAVQEVVGRESQVFEWHSSDDGWVSADSAAPRSSALEVAQSLQQPSSRCCNKKSSITIPRVFQSQPDLLQTLLSTYEGYLCHDVVPFVPPPVPPPLLAPRAPDASTERLYKEHLSQPPAAVQSTTSAAAQIVQPPTLNPRAPDADTERRFKEHLSQPPAVRDSAAIRDPAAVQLVPPPALAARAPNADTERAFKEHLLRCGRNNAGGSSVSQVNERAKPTTHEERNRMLSSCLVERIMNERPLATSAADVTRDETTVVFKSPTKDNRRLEATDVDPRISYSLVHEQQCLMKEHRRAPSLERQPFYKLQPPKHRPGTPRHNVILQQPRPTNRNEDQRSRTNRKEDQRSQTNGKRQRYASSSRVSLGRWSVKSKHKENGRPTEFDEQHYWDSMFDTLAEHTDPEMSDAGRASCHSTCHSSRQLKNIKSLIAKSSKKYLIRKRNGGKKTFVTQTEQDLQRNEEESVLQLAKSYIAKVIETTIDRKLAGRWSRPLRTASTSTSESTVRLGAADDNRTENEFAIHIPRPDGLGNDGDLPTGRECVQTFKVLQSEHLQHIATEVDRLRILTGCLDNYGQMRTLYKTASTKSSQRED